jgi:hypothetical protein
MKPHRSFRLVPCVFTFCLLAIAASAQTPGGNDNAQQGSEWSIHTGPLLPNQIDGMSEIQPVWGLRYGAPSGSGVLEINLANSRAEGVTYYDGYVSYRYDVILDEVTGFIYGGADLHQWSSPPDGTTRVVPGLHVGSGILMPLAGLLWFRSEMKFNMNPGTGLYIGFGLVLRLPGGGGAGG